MKQLFLLLVVPFLLLSSKSEDHKYYHSLSEIIYDQETKTIEVNMKVFFDDLQQAIMVEQNEVINDPIDQYFVQIEQYLNYHFLIKDGFDRKVELSLNSHKDELDEVWFYLKSEPIEFSNDWTIKNTLFVDLFASQVNLVNFYADNKNLNIVEGLLLNATEKEGTIHFNL